MRGRYTCLRVGALVAAGVASVLACVDLDSLSAGGARPEAGPDAGPDTFVPDPCAHTSPPGPPSGSADAGSLPTFELALSTIDLDPGGAPGFDLDRMCTCDERPGSARSGAPSCVRPPTPEPDCDLDGGADNAIGILERDRIPLQSPLTNRLNLSVAEGRRTLVIQVGAYNGLANDDEVEVGAMYALGIRQKGCPTSTAVADGGPWRPGGCGEDTWTIARSSVIEGARVLPVASTKGWVRDFQLVAQFKQDPVRLPFGEEQSFPLVVAVLDVKLVPLGVDLAPRDPSEPPTAANARLWRVDDGIIAGRVSTSNALETIGSIVVQGTPFCTTTSYATVRESLCRSADIAESASAPPGAACDALSGAGRITLVPARIGAVADDPPPFAGCDKPRTDGIMVCP